MKYRIRQGSIIYNKLKVKERRSKMAALESKLSDCQKMCDQDPSPENINKFEVLKTEFKLQNDYITQGAGSNTNPSYLVQARRKTQQIFFGNLEISQVKKVQFGRYLRRIVDIKSSSDCERTSSLLFSSLQKKC